MACQARKVSAGGKHEPFNAHDVTTDPPVTKLLLQADLNQSKEVRNIPFQPLLGSVSNAP